MQHAVVRKSRTLFALAVRSGLIALTGSASPASISDLDQLLVAFRANAQAADIAGALSSAGAADRSVIKGIGVHVVSTNSADRTLTALRHNRTFSQQNLTLC
jgi:hypothetical protein